GNNYVANNTAYNMASAIADSSAGTNVYYNNTCVACSLTPYLGYGTVSGIFIWYNGEPPGNTYGSNLAVSSASVFVDPANRNFQLASGTNALVDTGTSAPAGIFTTDANGVTRGREGEWDVGACERFSGATACPNFQGTY